MTIADAEKQIIDEFSLFTDWMDKYNYIIELGKSLPPIDPQYKTEKYIVSGCQSQVWLFARYENGKVIFSADSDAVITKGIVNLLIRVLSDKTPDEIIGAKMQYIDVLGLREHLSPTRSNGLLSMMKQMKLYAMVFKAKEKG
jgi:cysteine desulfuration protein SufE